MRELFFFALLLSFYIFSNQSNCSLDCEEGEYFRDCTLGCFECPLGYYCKGLNHQPIPCPKGTHQNQFGAKNSSACKECEEGYYSSEFGSNECKLCPAGFFCSSFEKESCGKGEYSLAGDNNCSLCPIGHYCPMPFLEPIKCPEGTFSDIKGKEKCNKCEIGTYSTIKGSTFCLGCGEGYMCPIPNREPIKCQKGTFSKENSSFCSVCPEGFFSNSTGMSMCYECEKGKYCPSIFTSGFECEDGSFNNMKNQTECKICNLGEYLDDSKNCVNCPRGFMCPDPLQQPIKCQNGLYSLEGSINCTFCEPGKYCQDPTLDPIPCGIGKFSTGGKVVKCSKCPMGYFSIENSSIACTRNIAGYGYKNSFTEPVKCLKGYYSPNFKSDCEKCPMGYYSEEGSASCKLCPIGYKCEDPTQDPKKCPNGKISRGGSTSCINCSKGFISNEEQSNCVACSTGHYCPDGINEIECEDGYFSSILGLEKCLECTPGFYCPVESKDKSPVICPQGSYSQSGKTNCSICPRGYSCQGNFEEECNEDEYSEEGDMQCHICPAGMFCISKSVVFPCLKGYYSLLGEVNCTLCPEGHSCIFQDIPPSICPPGMWSEQGSTYCKVCSQGKFCNVSGMGFEYDCNEGEYSRIGSTYCQICPPGFSCNKSSIISVCSIGYYSIGGMMECMECPKGMYCENIYETPKECNVGEFSTGKQIQCTKCPRGYVCPKKNTTGILCENGMYSNIGSTMCQECLSGFFCPSPDLEPIKCLGGTWSSNKQTYCTNCNEGYYCESGSTTATQNICPKGYYCPSGTNIPQKCPKGTYGDSYGLYSINQCEVCPQGYFCEAGSKSPLLEKQRCPPGFYCPLQTTKKNEYPCPAGTFLPYFGGESLFDCIECPEGFYCFEGTEDYSLNICPPGYFCGKKTTNPFENPCQGGYFNDESGRKNESECKLCPSGFYCPEASIFPIACSPGYYNKNRGSSLSSDCEVCPSGYSCPLQGANSILENSCYAGNFCGTGTSDGGNSCPSGTFSNRKNLSSELDCEICPEGFSCSSGTGGNIQPIPCSRGYYCPGAPQQKKGEVYKVYSLGEWGSTYTGTSNPTDYPCPIGTYSNKTQLKGIGECIDCIAGKYCSITGLIYPNGDCSEGYYCPTGSISSTQEECPPGTYSQSIGNSKLSQCENCPKGYYCESHTINPIPCGEGFFQENENAESILWCQECPGGNKCGEAQIIPIPCGSGFYSSNGENTCHSCQIGYYCPTNTTSEEEMLLNICPAGMFCPLETSVIPSSFNFACPRGSYCEEGTVSPTPCPGGTYGPTTGIKSKSGCTTCPHGFFCLSGEISPTGVCEKGHYCPDGSSSSKENKCPEGTYRSIFGGESIDSCAQCPSGFYCPLNTSDPIDCPSGHYCVIGSKIPSECPIGTIGNTTNLKDSTFCIPCPAGMYCDSTGLTKPTGECDAGFYCTGGSSSSKQTLCPRGGYCLKGSTYPSSCEKGTFNNETGGKSQSDCKNCTEGYYCSGSNNPYPTGKCYPGYYCLEGSHTPIQHNCPKGSYCEEGSPYPKECEPGSYNSEIRKSSCMTCPESYYCPNSNMTDFVNYYCPAGNYCPQGSREPVKCLLSTYSNTTHLKESEQCTPCEPGWYCDTEGITTPTGECDEGYYCENGCINSKPTDSCGGICPAGNYCPKGSYAPIPCPTSTFSIETGNIEVDDCKNCTPGMFCSVLGLLRPIGNCSEGYYCINGSDTPTPVDESFGDICPKGFYCPSGSDIPLPCPPGTFNSMTTQSDCKECPEGFFCNGSTISPSICPMGRYCPSSTGDPLLCPIGTFSNSLGLREESQCQLCKGGMYCSNEGLVEPNGICKKGYFCSFGAINEIGDLGIFGGLAGICPKGKYCEEKTKTPFPCPIGTFSQNIGNVDVSNCSLCSPGNYCSEPGQVETSGECEKGYYCTLGSIVSTPQDGQTGDICPLGSYCEKGSSYPTPCENGTFSNMYGSFECEICPSGYYCTVNTSSPIKCTEGYYCMEGTKAKFDYPCPLGSFSNLKGLEKIEDCQLCTGGEVCSSVGLTSPDGMCPEGFYCLRGSIDGKITSSLGGETGECYKGHYCPIGTEKPYPCPVGTFLNASGKSSISECIGCSPGYFCDENGLELPTKLCNEGYYCVFNSSYGTPSDGITGNICPKGHYCPKGTSDPIMCESGKYSPKVGSVECMLCPEGFYCNNGTIDPEICLEGYFCEEGSPVPSPCPKGTYSEIKGLTNKSQCTLCKEGMFCLDEGLVYPTGECKAGVFCNKGAVFKNSTFFKNGIGGICTEGNFCNSGSAHPYPCFYGSFGNITGLKSQEECLLCDGGTFCGENGLPSPSGLCSEGFYCPKGSFTPFQNYCPLGYYCEVGSSEPTPCPEGKYQSSIMSKSCMYCPSGYVCSEAESVPQICPIGFYCVNGIANECPEGTFSTQKGLKNFSECLVCPKGKYCQNGTIQGECNAGHICYFENSVPNPVDNGRKGGLCPAGHYCIQGCTQPEPCPVGTVSSDKGGTSISSCHLCRKGFYCVYENSVVEYDCPVGNFCDQNETGRGVMPIECEIGTYNNFSNGESEDDCLPCEKGFYCPSKGLPSTDLYPCSPGSYCPKGSQSPILCPSGTFRNVSRAGNIEDCYICEQGFYCPEGSISGIECSEGYYCIEGSKNETLCPEGFYCSRRTGNPKLCPSGFYCPSGTVNPIVCKGAVYCPEGSSTPLNCPDGYTENNSSSLKDTLDSSCRICTPGYYSNYENGLVCEYSSEGYVCGFGCTRKDPQNMTLHNGYKCPRGYYCGNGTGPLPLPCDVGTFSSELGQSKCQLCPENTYQSKKGKDHCKVCGTNSFSLEGSYTCTCNGTNRVFQEHDGSCICKEGYAYYNLDVDESEVDSILPCTEIVLERCGSNMIRSISGECISNSDISCSCNTENYEISKEYGVCLCQDFEIVDDICDEECRNNQLVVAYKPLSLTIEVYDPLNKTILDQFNVAQISGGNLYCDNYERTTDGEVDVHCKIHLMNTDKKGFYGLFDLGLDDIRGIFQRNNSPSILDMDFSSQSRRSIDSKSVLNPFVCLEYGESIIWKLYDGFYPVYVRNSLLNTNHNFDYGHFREIMEYYKKNVSLTNFIYTFEPGTYVFKMGDDIDKILIVKSVEKNSHCADDVNFMPLTTRNLVIGGSVINEDDFSLSPDWPLVIVLIIGVFVFLVTFLMGICFYRSSTMVFSSENARPTLPKNLKKKVNKYLNIRRNPTSKNEKNKEEEEEESIMEKNLIDLDGFDLLKFTEKFEKLKRNCEKYYGEYNTVLENEMLKIIKEAGEIKELISKKETKALIILINVNKYQKYFSDITAELGDLDNFYDEKICNNMLKEVEGMVKELKKEITVSIQFHNQKNEAEFKKLFDKEKKRRKYYIDDFKRFKGKIEKYLEKLKKNAEENKQKNLKEKVQRFAKFKDRVLKIEKKMTRKIAKLNEARTKMNNIIKGEFHVSNNITELERFFLRLLEDIFQKFKLEDDELVISEEEEESSDEEDLTQEQLIWKEKKEAEIVKLDMDMDEETRTYKKQISEIFDKNTNDHIDRILNVQKKKLEDPNLSQNERNNIIEKSEKEIERYKSSSETEKNRQLRRIELLLKDRRRRAKKLLKKKHQKDFRKTVDGEEFSKDQDNKFFDKLKNIDKTDVNAIKKLFEKKSKAREKFNEENKNKEQIELDEYNQKFSTMMKELEDEKNVKITKSIETINKESQKRLAEQLSTNKEEMSNIIENFNEQKDEFKMRINHELEEQSSRLSKRLEALEKRKKLKLQHEHSLTDKKVLDQKADDLKKIKDYIGGKVDVETLKSEQNNEDDEKLKQIDQNSQLLKQMSDDYEKKTSVIKIELDRIDEKMENERIQMKNRFEQTKIKELEEIKKNHQKMLEDPEIEPNEKIKLINSHKEEVKHFNDELEKSRERQMKLINDKIRERKKKQKEKLKKKLKEEEKKSLKQQEEILKKMEESSSKDQDNKIEIGETYLNDEKKKEIEKEKKKNEEEMKTMEKQICEEEEKRLIVIEKETAEVIEGEKNKVIEENKIKLKELKEKIEKELSNSKEEEKENILSLFEKEKTLLEEQKNTELKKFNNEFEERLKKKKEALKKKNQEKLKKIKKESEEKTQKIFSNFHLEEEKKKILEILEKDPSLSVSNIVSQVIKIRHKKELKLLNEKKLDTAEKVKEKIALKKRQLNEERALLKEVKKSREGTFEDEELAQFEESLRNDQVQIEKQIEEQQKIIEEEIERKFAEEEKKIQIEMERMKKEADEKKAKLMSEIMNERKKLKEVKKRSKAKEEQEVILEKNQEEMANFEEAISQEMGRQNDLLLKMIENARKKKLNSRKLKIQGEDRSSKNITSPNSPKKKVK